jgi:hypothetical protein
MALTFEGPLSFEHLEKGESVFFDLEGKQIELPTIQIPVDAIFHRADHEGAREPSADIPAFFGNRKSIALYARGKGDEAFSSYKVTRPMRLFEMTLNSIYDLYFHPDLSEDEKEWIQLYLKPEMGAVIPAVPTGPKGPTGHLPYLNREIAAIVCRLGFDGWIVLPFSPEKRQGLVQFSLVQRKLLPYSPEIMLCNWKQHMERVVRGGSKTRRYRSKARRTRKE